MAGDFCPTKTVTVTIQENGYIRNSHGYLIGKLYSEIDYNKVEESLPMKTLEIQPIDLQTMVKVYFDFFGKYLLLTENNTPYVWASSDYGGDNTIRRYKGDVTSFLENSRYKGQHLVREYCGENVTFC